MRKRILQGLTRNIGLKVLALAFAIVLWLAVVNINDPQQTRTYTVKVSVENADVLAEEGKYYEVSGGRDTVTFRVSAKRSVHEDLSNSDFKATADLSRLEEETRVPVEITATRHASQLTIANRSYYLYVSVGSTLSNKFVITPVVNGEPGEGFAVGGVSVEPNVVTVSGPEEVVSRISQVTATCGVSGMSGDIVESVVPLLLDENGFEIPQNDLTLSVATVDVKVDMKTLRTVPIEVAAGGTLPEGLYLDHIEAEPSSLEIIGEASAVNEVTSIAIPASAVNLSTVTDDTDLTVDVSSYLPEGVAVYGGNSRVTLHVVLEQPVTETVTLPASQIVISNVPSGLTASVTDTQIEVRLTGYASEIASLDLSTLAGVVDGTNLTEGTNTAKVTVNVNARITAEADTVTVEAAAQEETAEEEEADASEEDKDQDSTQQKVTE